MALVAGFGETLLGTVIGVAFGRVLSPSLIRRSGALALGLVALRILNLPIPRRTPEGVRRGIAKEKRMDRIEDYYYELSDQALENAYRSGDSAVVAALIARLRDQGKLAGLSDADQVIAVLGLLADNHALL